MKNNEKRTSNERTIHAKTKKQKDPTVRLFGHVRLCSNGCTANESTIAYSYMEFKTKPATKHTHRLLGVVIPIAFPDCLFEAPSLQIH